MRTIAILLMTLFVSSCGGGGEAGSTPEETFRAGAKAMAESDYETIYELMQPSKRGETRKSWEDGDEKGRGLQREYAEKLGLSFDEVKDRPFKDVYIEFLEKTFDELRKLDPERWDKLIKALPDAEILEIIYDDDKTRAKVRYRAGDQKTSAYLHLEDGRWYHRFERR